MEASEIKEWIRAGRDQWRDDHLHVNSGLGENPFDAALALVEAQEYQIAGLKTDLTTAKLFAEDKESEIAALMQAKEDAELIAFGLRQYVSRPPQHGYTPQMYPCIWKYDCWRLYIGQPHGHEWNPGLDLGDNDDPTLTDESRAILRAAKEKADA